MQEYPAASDGPLTAKSYYWLLCHAISLEYYDSKDGVNSASDASRTSAASVVSGAGGSSHAGNDTSVTARTLSPGEEAILDEILVILKVSPSTTKSASAVVSLCVFLTLESVPCWRSQYTSIFFNHHMGCSVKAKFRLVYQTLQRIKDAKKLHDAANFGVYCGVYQWKWHNLVFIASIAVSRPAVLKLHIYPLAVHLV